LANSLFRSLAPRIGGVEDTLRQILDYSSSVLGHAALSKHILSDERQGAGCFGLYGAQGLGKTCIALNAAENLASDPHVLACKFDLV
jgi:hypothetical protein